MIKATVVHDSKCGNTKLVAEAIAQGINQVPGVEIVVTKVDTVDLSQIDKFDVILIGSPNHIGGPTRAIKKFIDSLGKLKLEGKRGAVFDTYTGTDFEKAVKKMEKQIAEKVAGLKLITPGFSIRVNATKGPVTDGELPKCKEFGIKIATLINQ